MADSDNQATHIITATKRIYVEFRDDDGASKVYAIAPFSIRGSWTAAAFEVPRRSDFDADRDVIGTEPVEDFEEAVIQTFARVLRRENPGEKTVAIGEPDEDQES